MPKRWHPRARALLERKVIARDGDWCLLCVLEGKPVEPIGRPTLDHVNNNRHDDRLANLIRLCHEHNAAEGGRYRQHRPRLITPENLKAKRAEALASQPVRAEEPPVAAASLPSGAPKGPSVAPRPGEPPINNRRPHASDPPPGSSVTCACVSECVCDRTGEGPPGRAPEHVARIAHVASDRPDLDTAAQDSAVLQEMMEPLFRLWLYVVLRTRGQVTKGEALDAGGEFITGRLGRGNQITLGRYFRKASNSINGWLEEARDDRGRAVYTLRSSTDGQALYHLLYGRVLALNALLCGPPVDISDLTLKPQGGPDV